jgi:hypothetical protein
MLNHHNWHKHFKSGSTVRFSFKERIISAVFRPVFSTGGAISLMGLDVFGRT